MSPDMSAPDNLSPAAVAQPTRPSLEIHRLEFRGNTQEYFRIWIVNIFLTIVTLGIYYAWAKVRTRRYFYSNTYLAGHPFEYLADPIPILKGNLIVGGSFAVFLLLQSFAPDLSLVALGLFFLVYPFLVYQSLRFLALNSAYRNIRFRFHGTLGQAYLNYFLWPLLTPFTLGLLAPYAAFRQRQYVFGNGALGTSRSSFRGEPGPFYSVYFAAFGLGILLSIVAFILVSVVGSGAFLEDGDIGSIMAMLPALAVMYGVILLGSLAIQQYISTRIANYCWDNTSVPDQKIRFSSSLKVGELIGMRITNTLAIIFTLGLAIPWTKVRYAKYVLGNLSVMTYGNLEEFVAARSTQTNALGDAATDFFNIDIGL